MDRVMLSLPPGPGVSFGEPGDPEEGEGAEGKVGLLATRVRGGWIPAGLGEPGEPGYGNGNCVWPMKGKW